jgi:hypothetical protein
MHLLCSKQNAVQPRAQVQWGIGRLAAAQSPTAPDAFGTGEPGTLEKQVKKSWLITKLNLVIPIYLIG